LLTIKRRISAGILAVEMLRWPFALAVVLSIILPIALAVTAAFAFVTAAFAAGIAWLAITVLFIAILECPRLGIILRSCGQL